MQIDEDRSGLVVEKIREVLKEVDSHKAGVFNQAFWNWQYRDAPAGRARVYGIMAGGELKGYYHVPVYEARIDGRTCLLAMVQEVAVSRDLRGQGMFRRLADFVTEDLMASGIEAAYTFPNRRSIHTFLKYNGYRRIATLPTYILPVACGPLIGSRLPLGRAANSIGRIGDRCMQAVRTASDPLATVMRHPRITPSMVDCFAAFQQTRRVTLQRDARYLSWRFQQRPQAQHFFFSLQRRETVRAAAIFKLDEMLGHPALLLMDFAHRPGEEQALLRLIQHLKQAGSASIGRPFHLIFACANSSFAPLLMKIGFLPVPSRFNPRPLNLLVRNLAGSTAAVFDPQAWHVTLADWDVM